MPAWVIMRQIEPMCVVFSEADAWRYTDRDRFLHYRQVSMGPHPSVAAMDFQMQQTNSWKWKAKRYEKAALRLEAAYDELAEKHKRLTTRLAMMAETD